MLKGALVVPGSFAVTVTVVAPAFSATLDGLAARLIPMSSSSMVRVPGYTSRSVTPWVVQVAPIVTFSSPSTRSSVFAVTCK